MCFKILWSLAFSTSRLLPTFLLWLDAASQTAAPSPAMFLARIIPGCVYPTSGVTHGAARGPYDRPKP